jgi:hypothetical protein
METPWNVSKTCSYIGGHHKLITGMLTRAARVGSAFGLYCGHISGVQTYAAYVTSFVWSDVSGVQTRRRSSLVARQLQHVYLSVTNTRIQRVISGCSLIVLSVVFALRYNYISMLLAVCMY